MHNLVRVLVCSQVTHFAEPHQGRLFYCAPNTPAGLSLPDLGDRGQFHLLVIAAFMRG